MKDKTQILLTRWGMLVFLVLFWGTVFWLCT
jgi:hypothetical protein